MFRRRPFRRGRLFPRRLLMAPMSGGLQQATPLAPGARQMLARANNLMASGQYAEAAEMFGNLSQEAAQRGMPAAANLALQAARAYFAAENVAAALQWARQALQSFAQSGRAGRVPQVLSQMTAALRQKGYNAEADQLEQEAAQMSGEMGASLDEVSQRVPQAAERRGNLPARCPGCGAPLAPEEVEWHDAHTAECPYCATIVKAV